MTLSKKREKVTRRAFIFGMSALSGGVIFFSARARKLFSYSSVAANALNTLTSIPSEGSIKYPKLVVRGKQIVDPQAGQSVLLKGFSLWEPDIWEWHWRTFLSPERFQEIKNWGFNIINIPVSWARCERSASNIGVYDEANLQRLEELLRWIGDAGLYATLSIRVMNLWWDQEQGINYSMTEEGRTRYGNFLQMIVQRFDHYENLIGYNGWHFPYCGYSGHWSDTAWEQSYYQHYTPIIVDKIRSNSSKIIFYSPIYQGGWNPPDTGAFATLTPLSDPNVVYCHKLHWPKDVESEGADWNYNMEELRGYMQQAVDFQNAYSVPLAAWEFGMWIHGVCPERPIKQSRLDYLDAKLQLMKEQGNYNWAYWAYCKWEPEGSYEAIFEEDETPTAVVEVLRRNT